MATPGNQLDGAASEAADAVRRLLPGAEVRSVVPLGRGTDHVAFVVDAGDDRLVLRRRLDAGDRSASEREARLLDVIAEVSPIPVPRVVAFDPVSGWMAARQLVGTSLLDSPVARPIGLAHQLATFLAAIHGVASDLVADLIEPDSSPLSEYFDEARTLVPRVAHLLVGDQLALVERFLASEPPPGADVALVCHHDLGAEHVLVDRHTERITGVIDWSDAAIADPARDLGRLHRDLGPDVAARIVSLLGWDADVELRHRIVFHARCALVEDLAFGVETGDDRYVRAALDHLDRTFAPTADMV